MSCCRPISIIIAQHMFFIHRAQHFVLHHAGAFLIGLSARVP
jgi:putative membrane protein